ncbi:excalibur calcium-binding domain-containing protein [Roseomonas sp. USHLN139]|uniref:excalibur calcium-binding domain-containing protein n=1 Tax=Roseomonas sp. USHLN139 TaxID=3081298 RepID=UPI003FA681CB
MPEHERRAPWDWRHSGGAASRTAAPRQSTPAPPSGSGFSCGTKRYCGQMLNCAEAQFYFRRCGVTRLDGDRDGIPCERLCR